MDSLFSIPWHLAIIAFACAVVVTPVMIRIARRVGWIAAPSKDRWHTKPTALMGGVPIFVSCAVAVAFLPGAGRLALPLAGAVLMCATGFVDDLIALKPSRKFLLQVLAATLPLFAGYEFAPDWPTVVSIPLTLLWMVGITNAFNLLDNMDGLTAGTAAIAATMLAIFATIYDLPVTVGALLALVGACCGFLVYNFNPAKIFMGDSGSLFLGYSVAALSLTLQYRISAAGVFGILLVPAAVLAVPIFDTTLVTVARIRAGRSVAQGGRDHSSHRLVFLGFSERKAVLTLYVVSAVFGGMGLLFHYSVLSLVLSLLIFLVVGLVVLGFYIGSVNVYEPAGGEQEQDASPRGVLLRRVMNKEQFLLFAGDSCLVVASFVLAGHLRFEDGPPESLQGAYDVLLPALVVAKVVAFQTFGVYRGSLRHAGTSELVRIAVAAVVCMPVSFGIGWAVFMGYPHSKALFIIDGMLTMFSVGGLHFGFRALRQLFAAQREVGRRALLYGAGDAGHLLLSEIRQNPEIGLAPVGFVDDDPRKLGLRVQGLPVVGSGDQLADLFEQHRVETLMISATRIPTAKRTKISRACRAAGVSCSVFEVSVQPVATGLPVNRPKT